MDNPTLNCEYCGRAAGSAMFDCLERPDNCPYVFKRHRLVDDSEIRFAILTAALIFTLSMALPVMFSFDWCWVVPLIFLFIGLYWVLSYRTITLYNPVIGTMWRASSPSRIKFKCIMVNNMEQLTLDLDLPRPLDYPPSISALTTLQKDRASDLFETALIGLLAKKLISLRYGTVYESYFNKQFRPKGLECQIIPGEKVSGVTVNGVLEQKILNIVQRWFGVGDVVAVMEQIEDRGYPLSIFQLVKDVYPSDQSNPGRWLIKKVEQDAVTRRLGKRAGVLKKHLELDPAHLDKLRDEEALLRSVRDQLSQFQPDLVQVMKTQIKDGIEARIWVSGPM